MKRTLYALIISIIIAVTACGKSNNSSDLSTVKIKYQVKVENGTTEITYSNASNVKVTFPYSFAEWDTTFQVTTPYLASLSAVFTRTPNSTRYLRGEVHIYSNNVVVAKDTTRVGDSINGNITRTISKSLTIQ